MTAPVELVRELLYYRDMKMVSGRDWGMITALIAGSSIAFPVLAPVALGSMVVLIVNKLRGLRRRAAIAGVALAPCTVAAEATTLFGVPRRFRATVNSLVDDAPVLLEHAIVRDRTGAVLLRRSQGAAFLLDPERRSGSDPLHLRPEGRSGSDPLDLGVEDHGPVLVTGAARLTALSLFVLRTPVRRGDPRLQRMGIPDDLAVSGELEIATLTEQSPALAVTGVVEQEAIAELAFHRDGGRIQVMRGRAGAPVLVEDRRLIGAALLR